MSKHQKGNGNGRRHPGHVQDALPVPAEPEPHAFVLTITFDPARPAGQQVDFRATAFGGAVRIQDVLETLVTCRDMLIVQSARGQGQPTPVPDAEPPGVPAPEGMTDL